MFCPLLLFSTLVLIVHDVVSTVSAELDIPNEDPAIPVEGSQRNLAQVDEEVKVAITKSSKTTTKAKRGTKKG